MNITRQTKAWLRFFRAHTVVLEAPMALLGAAIGIGSVLDPRVGLWLLFGVAYHNIGYGMNSYVDWKKGFDKDDERKQHHPLNTDEIKPNTAKKVTFILMALLVTFLAVMTISDIVALGLSVLMVVSGVAYNYFGKYTSLKAVPISIAHTLVFFIPYYLYTDSITVFGILITSAYFVHHFYQIAVSGDIKDIDQDEASLIQKLGAKLVDGEIMGVNYFITTNKILIFGYGTAVVEMFLAHGAVFYMNPSPYVIGITAIMGTLTIYDTDNMLQSGAFEREKRLEYISRREFFGYTMIHSASILVIGWEAFAVLIISMLVYLATVSKFIWGNWLVPDV